MKKLILYLFLFLLPIIFSNCSKEDCYSCNPEVNAWVKNNTDRLLKMDRLELSKLEMPYQKAALRMFSPKRKKFIWQDKFNQIKSLSLTKKEFEHLDYIDQFLNSHNFKESISEKEEKKFLNWAEEGKSKFGWTDKFLVKAFFIIEDVDSPRDEEMILWGPDEKDCSCRYDIYCVFGEASTACLYSTCTETDSGCGLMGRSSCTGECD